MADRTTQQLASLQLGCQHVFNMKAYPFNMTLVTYCEKGESNSQAANQENTWSLFTVYQAHTMFQDKYSTIFNSFRTNLGSDLYH